MDILLQRAYFDVVEKDCGQYDTVTEVMWVTGAALFIRLADYREVGGLDDHFLLTWKKLTCVGVCAAGEKSLSVFRKVWYIT